MNTLLKDARVRKNLSMIEVAKRLGVSRQTIWNYENGVRVPKCKQLIPISDVYGITVKQLIESLTPQEKK